MIKPSFSQIFTIALIALVVFIGSNNVKTQRAAVKYQSETERLQMELESSELLNDRLSARIDELEEANTALIRVCNPSLFRKVAKNTPLPKMKEA